MTHVEVFSEAFDLTETHQRASQLNFIQSSDPEFWLRP